jgi:hypothetical protein
MGEKVVQLPASKVFKMMATIERLEKQSQASNLISEEEAAALLNINVRTLRNKYHQKLLEGLYTVSPVNGDRFYFKDKILGLN